MPDAIRSELLFKADAGSTGALYAQLAAFLADAIRSGRIVDGERLPSERLYAERLGVSRTTVTAAFAELKAEGLVRAHVGRGVVVVFEEGRERAAAISWAQISSRFAQTLAPAGTEAGDGIVGLADGWLHSTLIPGEALSECAAAVAGRPEAFTKTASILGLAELREALVEGPLRTACPAATPAGVLVTGGAQQGLNVIARAFLSPGDIVLCESPTWHGAVRAFRSAGAEVIGIGSDREGIEPDIFEDALARHRPKFVYLIPSFQCPTGTVMSVDRRRRVLALCARFRTPIVESHVYGDTAFGTLPPTLKSLDESDLVVHQGSASKSIAPSLRLGWLVAPRGAMDYLAAAKANLDLSTPPFSQALLAAFLRSGAYARHLPDLRTALRRRRDTLVAALAEHCPTLRFTAPQGGLYLWAQLPAPLRSREIEAAAAAAGVAIRGGEIFLPEGGPSHAVRLCYAAPPLERIETGVRRLGEALEQLRGRNAASDAHGPGFAPV